MARKKVIKIRLDDDEMALVDEAVAGIGIPLATWARYALLNGTRARLSVLLLGQDQRREEAVDL